MHLGFQSSYTVAVHADTAYQVCLKIFIKFLLILIYFILLDNSIDLKGAEGTCVEI